MKFSCTYLGNLTRNIIEYTIPGTEIYTYIIILLRISADLNKPQGIHVPEINKRRDAYS